jgi:16S rRNA (cytidine1402-2'-O)-methyltransferase
MKDAAVEQPIAPGLYIVATPIGNLEDITLRALRVLRQADCIACEDTRQTHKLLAHFGISTPTISYHQHNERSRGAELLTRLQQGARIALVSDAGLPGISDPGAEIVQLAIAAGIAVVPIPGACAAVTALAAAGLATEQFRFLGFAPARAGERRSFFASLSNERATLVFYEAPHRILATLEDAIAVFGAERTAVLARELTKVHEEFLRGPLHALLASLRAREMQRGEMTLLLAGAPESAAQSETAPQTSVRARLAELMQSESLDEMAALKRIARERGASKSALYRELQRERSR